MCSRDSGLYSEVLESDGRSVHANDVRQFSLSLLDALPSCRKLALMMLIPAVQDPR
jgi:hypothetical protein